MIPSGFTGAGFARSWRNTSGGATTSGTNDSTDEVYGDGDAAFGYTSTCVYCDKEEEEEIPVEEEPFQFPGDEHFPNIRDYFGIVKEPP